MSYQWYSNSSAANTGGSPISGATGDRYTPPTDTADTFYYYVVVTNTKNGATATETSTTATVTVNNLVHAIVPAPDQWSPNRYVYSDPSTTVTVTLSNSTDISTQQSTHSPGSTTYQWYSNTTNSNSGGTQIPSETTASYMLPTTSPMVTFYYYVEVTNTINDNGDTGIKTVTAASGTVEVVYLGVPTGVSAIGAGPGKIYIKWDSVSGAASYTVYRADSSGGNYSSIASGITDLYYTDTGLTEGTTYYYKVSAVNGAVEGSKSNEVSGRAQYEIRGPGPAGGVIFYINPNYQSDGWRYLEAAPANEEFTAVWGDSSNINGTSRDIGTGKSNTDTIVNALGSYNSGNYAANLCKNLSINYGGTTYDDWFLPSRDEVNAMYDNLGGMSGGFQNAAYWSSSQYSSSNAVYVHFSNRFQGQINKSNTFVCRAIRAF